MEPTLTLQLIIGVSLSEIILNRMKTQLMRLHGTIPFFTFLQKFIFICFHFELYMFNIAYIFKHIKEKTFLQET